MDRPTNEDQQPDDTGAKLLGAVRQIRVKYRRWALLVAIIVFAGGVYLTLPSIDFDIAGINWALLGAIAAVGVPATVVLNAAEVRAAAAASDGSAIAWDSAVEVAVNGTAANLLPVPGATLVRVEALTASGASGRSALRYIAAMGLVWVGVSAVVAGALLLPLNPLAGSGAWLLVFVVSFGIWTLVGFKGRSSWLRRVLVIEALALGVTATRLWAIAHAIGVEAGPRAATVMGASYALTSAIGVFPGGLGLREALSSGLGALAGAAGSTGFAVSAIDRLLGLVIHLPITALLMLRSGRKSD